MKKKAFPDAIFGCGHLSPIGWCGPCAFAQMLRDHVQFERMKAEARAAGTLIYEDEGSLFTTDPLPPKDK